MGEMCLHAHPCARLELDGFAVHIEADPTGDDLHERRHRRGVIGQLLTVIESEHDHPDQVVAVQSPAERSVFGYLNLGGEIEEHGRPSIR